MFKQNMDQLREDCILSEILEERKSLTGFLDAVFGFLSRKTDFYHVHKTKYDKLGFPRGIKEQILLSSMQKFEKSQETVLQTTMHDDVPPLAIEEVEIESSAMMAAMESPATEIMDSQNIRKRGINVGTVSFTEHEYRNGAIFEKYCWSQTPKELEVTVLLPTEIRTGKHVRLDLRSAYISIKSLIPNEMELISGDTWDKFKHNDVVWTIGDGKLILSIDKSKECWWDKLFTHELSIDIKKLDTDRHISEFPEGTQRAIEKMETEEMTNEEQGGLPMSKSEQLSRLRQAWNADDSPFKGQTFDPSIMQFY